MRTMLLLGALLLAGCDRRARLLEQDYAQAATNAEKCRIAQQIADVYLQRSDAKQHERWALARDVDCLAAQSGA